MSSIDPLSILSLYYPPASASFDLLVWHSKDVATLALDIAHHKEKLNIDLRFLWEAAMLHDIGIFLTNSPDIYCYGREPYVKHGILGAEILRKHHLHRHALVAERHTSSGLAHEEIIKEHLPLPLDRSYIPETIEEKLVCYADCFYSKTHLGERKSVETIIHKMERMWKHFGLEGDAMNVKRFKELHKLFSI